MADVKIFKNITTINSYSLEKITKDRPYNKKTKTIYRKPNVYSFEILLSM